METSQRGHLSRELLENPLAKEAFDTIEQSIIQEWELAKDTLQREEAWHALQGLRRFKNVFTAFVQNAEFEDSLKEKLNG